MQGEKMTLMVVITLFIFSTSLLAQDTKVKPVLFDGVINVGYINNGGYLNFSGPSLSLAHKNSKFSFGMLPGLRYKVDKGPDPFRNPSVFPNLGFGFTYSYKFFSLQLPFYSNLKTPTSNGGWHMGFGVGYRINAWNKKS